MTSRKYFGFVHSSYLFGLESHIVQTSINANIVPPGALLSLIQKGLYYTEAELSIGDDGQERTCDSLSLIDAVVPEIVENRRKELLQQQQQQQQQQSSSSSSGTSIKNEAKVSSRTTASAASNLSNTNDKDLSSIHPPSNTSPQSTNQTISERNIDTSSTPNGGMNYGHSNSSSTSQSHHYHPSSSSHPNTLHPSAAGNYSQMSNGNDNSSHSSYPNNTNHIAGFVHSSYLFGLESHIVQTSINANIVPPGALLSLIQKGLYYTEAELSIGDDGQERTCDSLSLIDAVVPEIVENRRKELLQQQQQQQQQSSSSSSGTSIKNEAKVSSRTTASATSNLSNTNDKDLSSVHPPSNTSPQSTNQTISERNIDTSSTPNGGMNYGHSNSSSTSQSHHYHPSSSSHPNTLHPSAAGNYSQMSNGNDNSSHSSYPNNTNHIAGTRKKDMKTSINDN
ncbi:unnamed protein product [Adineta steineri]|uniref:Uncharacterized protein n=1 Tax=Adineta steineri TaxID=433720 RepID=A0A814JJ75_9BILA|nr:unnamed protein product [Adineta steineri]